MNAEAPIVANQPWDALTCSRVGRLAAYGFTNAEIADSMHLSEDEIAEIRLNPSALEAQASQMQARQDQAMLVEDGWNTLEELSLTKVLTMLQYNSDPTFALLAARTANQANRRASNNRRVLDAGRAGTTIVLNLGAAFVKQIQTEGIKQSPLIEGRPKKISDMLNPAQASKLLGVETQSELEADINVRIAEALHLE